MAEMKVLSFDVGTRTLSYCVLQHDDAASSLVVHAWETVDVHTEAQLSEKAKPTMKEDAEYVMNALHARKTHLWSLHPDVVIIEQQPAGGTNRFSSVRMKCLSHVIHAFFYNQQLEPTCGMHADGSRVPVTFVSPSSKLTGMPSSTSTPPTSQNDRSAMSAKYRRNKQYAVDMTALLLNNLEPGVRAQMARTTFENARGKQDDLSDCFMLAYAYAQKHENKSKKRKLK